MGHPHQASIEVDAGQFVIGAQQVLCMPQTQVHDVSSKTSAFWGKAGPWGAEAHI